MMRRIKTGRLTAGMAGLLAMSLLTAACGGGDEAGGGSKAPNGDKKEITIGWVSGWDEDVAITHFWKSLLEKEGYTVKLQNLEAAPLYQGMAKGDVDVYFDGWLPITHADYWKRYGDDLEKLGIWYEGEAKNTLAVPTYMKDVNSMADLKGKGARFGDRIVGIEPGAGLTRLTETGVIPKYGLKGEYELKKSSSPAMLAELKKATKDKEPIVVTLWRPHWAYSAFPIKDLKDPEGALGKAEEVHNLAREGFTKDYPKFAALLKKFKMDEKQLAELENLVVNKAGEGKEAEGVAEWMKANPDFVDQVKF